MRWRRKYAKMRAYRKHFALRSVADNTGSIRTGDILLFSTFRNENVRLPYFLDYYRRLGVRGGVALLVAATIRPRALVPLRRS